MARTQILIGRVVLGLLLIGAAAPLWADRIVLRSGESIHGTIISETAKRVSIRFRSTMVIHVQKSKIREIVRTRREEPRAVIRLEDLTEEKSGAPADEKAAPPAAEKKEDPPAANGKAPPDAPPVLAAPSTGTTVDSRKEGAVTIERRVVVEAYQVRGGDFADAYEDIHGRDGKGFEARRGRRASHVTLDADFSGVAAAQRGGVRWADLVIRSTVTVVEPSWEAPNRVGRDDIEAWNRYLAEVQAIDGDRREIFSRGVSAAAEALSFLRAATDEELRSKSREVFNEEIRQAQKRVSGFNRRHREPSLKALATPAKH